MALVEGQLVSQHKVQTEMRAGLEENVRQIAELRERLAVKENDNIREVKRREKTQKELQDARTKLDDKAHREEELLQEIDGGKKSIADLERQVNDAKATMEKYLRDYEGLAGRNQKVCAGRFCRVT